MRLPTFSRSTDERTVAADGSTAARPDGATTTRFPAVDGGSGRPAHRGGRDETTADLYDSAARATAEPADRATADRVDTKADGSSLAQERNHDRAPAPRPDKKPRASLMATLGLILGVVSALLVLSGPLLGYGMALAVPALLVSVLGFLATRRRHVAGKSDALIGMALSIAAIVVGALALTGSLSWLGTDMQPVDTVREWLDARFVDRF